MEKIAKDKQKAMLEHGFNENGLGWCIFGDDTYAIKDWLKEQGCLYDPIFKWHSDHPLDLPDGYGMISFKFDELFYWDEVTHKLVLREHAQHLYEKAVQTAMGPNKSSYIGEIGERLRDLTVVYQSTRGFSGRYGWTNIYTFKMGDDVLVWFTSKELGLAKGDVLNMTATIKAHTEFRGICTTQISRAVITKVGALDD